VEDGATTSDNTGVSLASGMHWATQRPIRLTAKPRTKGCCAAAAAAMDPDKGKVSRLIINKNLTRIAPPDNLKESLTPNAFQLLLMPMA
jgi:hypothetical protein